MIVRIELLHRRSGLSAEAFGTHWREATGPIGATLPDLCGYHQNLVVGSTRLEIEARTAAEGVDGLSEFWFDDLESMHRAIASDAARRLVEDEAWLTNRMEILAAEQDVFLPPPADRALLKCMATLRRRPDLRRGSFWRKWSKVNASLATRLPHLKGCTQNYIVGRPLQRGGAGTSPEVPIDGVMELWFDDLPGLESTLAIDASTGLRNAYGELVHDLRTFHVAVHVVVERLEPIPRPLLPLPM